ncbi:MAG TPA: LD-carboxypeptidase [Bacteroidia bacterium]|nr:LD-carboxypeptidase [Bacteroidia bacterium]
MTDRRSFIRTIGIASAAMSLPSFARGQSSAVKSQNAGGALKPARLKPGDLIAFTAPAGAIFNDDSVQKATAAFEAQGFRVKHGKTLSEKFGYLAGKDDLRAKELQDLFSDKETKAIMAMRGGWGSARLLPLIDPTIIAASPKIFSGFSDITTLLAAFQVTTGLVTFHGPVGNSSLEDFTMTHFLDLVANAASPELVQDDVTILAEGEAEGMLLGGNLTVLCAMIGTPWMPELKDSLLFLEETEEEPYSIDRMLTQLTLAGVFTKTKGVVFGQCVKCVAEEPEKSFTLDEVLRQKLSSLGIPVMTGFSFGHIKDKFTLPLGIRARMSTQRKSLQLLESSVA